MDVRKYLDSTYLKTHQQSGLTLAQTYDKVLQLCDEAIENGFFAVMIRPDYVQEVREYLISKNSHVVLGTVIGFHEGTMSSEEKEAEAQKAIADGADELDFVFNYTQYIQGNIDYCREEFRVCTQLCLDNLKIAKWIIEVAALSDSQIENLTRHLQLWADKYFDHQQHSQIFVKSSTGFFETSDGRPNGATFPAIQLMLENVKTLPIKAAGGVKSPDDARRMLALGVKRIGTSSAISLITESKATEGY